MLTFEEGLLPVMDYFNHARTADWGSCLFKDAGVPQNVTSYVTEDRELAVHAHF